MSLRALLLATLTLSAAIACSVPASNESASNAPASKQPLASTSSIQPYVLPDTQVLPVESKSLQRSYQLFVALPETYAAEPSRRYPVLFVTDANYAFPLIRAISRRVGDHGKGLEDFILVGLSYAKGDSPAYSRRRDYTPTDYLPRSETPDESGRPIVHGQAEAYRRFIADEVFPLVARTYRADMARKVFAGHSYGSLLGAHILLTEPSMFQHYILGSPSLWFDHKVMFQREREYAGVHADLVADVFMGIGSYERSNPASGDPRFDREGDMVADMQAFERALKSRRYPGLRVESTVIDGEDHLTVAPVIITRGLRHALPARKVE